MKKNAKGRQHSLFPQLAAFLSANAKEWDAATCQKATRLAMTMRISGVDEPDRDLKALTRQIDRYHREQFEAANRASTLRD